MKPAMEPADEARATLLSAQGPLLRALLILRKQAKN